MSQKSEENIIQIIVWINKNRKLKEMSKFKANPWEIVTKQTILN